MRSWSGRALMAGAVAAAALPVALGPGAPAGAAPPGSDCPLFPADNAWHADISQLPAHPRSAAWLASMGGPARRLHPDFGPAGPGEQPYGIPYVVVDGTKPRVAVNFDYDDESDAGPYPFGPDTPVEGGSDRHALMVDRSTCTLYELFAAEWNGGAPTAGSGAIWDLRSHALRPAGWTSADAAGLPILPGLLRRDEVAAGHVDHAIRLTASRTDRSYLWPARHQAGAANDPNLPPMGARFRLRADFDVTRYRPDTQVVLRALQRHGFILADNGSNWYFTGTSEPGWDTGLLDELKGIPSGAFEAVDASSLMAEPNSGRVAGAAPAPAPATPAPPATTVTTQATPTTTRPRPTTSRPAVTTTTAAPTTTTAAAPPTTSPGDGDDDEEPTTTTAAPATGRQPGTTPGTMTATGPGLRVEKRFEPRPWLVAAGAVLAGGLGVLAFRLRPRRRDGTGTP